MTSASLRDAPRVDRAFSLAAERAPLLLALALSGVTGCIGISPEEARYEELLGLGADDDGDEEHNPGFPCVDCHGRDYSPGEDVFALAGTVYANTEDPNEMGLRGVTVHFRDANGWEADAVTNDAGNFMFKAEDGGRDRARRGEGDGETRLDYFPEYPIEVWITDEATGIEQRMEAPLLREASCATCHWGDPNASSIGRIFLHDPP